MRKSIGGKIYSIMTMICVLVVAIVIMNTIVLKAIESNRKQ